MSFLTFLLLFGLGISFAYSNKPKEIKYGHMEVQSITPAISTVKKISHNITSTKPGIKITVKENNNDAEMIQRMLEGNVDIIIASRDMNDDEEAIAKEYNISYKKLPFAISKDDTNQIYYMYINDMNYNHKPQNKVFAKNYYGDDRSLVVTTDVNPLPDEEYNKVIDYLKLIDEF